MLPAIIILIGTCMVAGGTFWLTKRATAKSTKTLEGVMSGNEIGLSTNTEVQNLRSQNLELTKKSDTLQGKVDKQSSTIDDLRQENTDLHSKLASKALDIYYNVTGKGHPVIYAKHNEFDIVSLVIENKTEYPIYDVNMIFPDPIKSGTVRAGLSGRMSGKMRMEEYANLNERIPPFNLAKGEKHEFYTFKFPQDWSELNFEPINIVTRSGSYIGKINVKQGYNSPYESEISDLKGKVLDKMSKAN